MHVRVILLHLHAFFHESHAIDQPELTLDKDNPHQSHPYPILRCFLIASAQDLVATALAQHLLLSPGARTSSSSEQAKWCAGKPFRDGPCMVNPYVPTTSHNEGLFLQEFIVTIS